MLGLSVSVALPGVVDARLIFTTEDDGVNADAYHIDNDDSSTDYIDLAFGSGLTNLLRWDITLSKFILNQNLDLSGKELLDFLVQNETTSNMSSECDTNNKGRMYYDTTDNELKFCQYDGTSTYSWVDAQDINSTELSELAGAGLVVNGSALDLNTGTGLEVSEDAIQISAGGVDTTQLAADAVTSAKIATDTIVAGDIAAGAVATSEILDDTIAFADIAEREATETLTPEYPNFTLNADGTNNIGTLESDYDATGARNFYKWSTKKTATAQDYDLVVQWVVPENFQGFSLTDPEIEVDFKTDTITATDNKLDITLNDTAGTSVTLTGGSGLVSSVANTWIDDSAITFTGGTFTPGEYVTLRIKMTSKATSTADLNPAYIGAIKLNYRVK